MHEIPCNVSDHGIVASLTSALKRLHLTGHTSYRDDQYALKYILERKCVSCCKSGTNTETFDPNFSYNSGSRRSTKLHVLSPCIVHLFANADLDSGVDRRSVAQCSAAELDHEHTHPLLRDDLRNRCFFARTLFARALFARARG